MMLSAVMLIVSLKTYEISPTVTTVTAACNINIDATVIMANSDTAQVPTFLYPSTRFDPVATAYRGPNSKTDILGD